MENSNKLEKDVREAREATIQLREWGKGVWRELDRLNKLCERNAKDSQDNRNDIIGLRMRWATIGAAVPVILWILSQWLKVITITPK